MFNVGQSQDISWLKTGKHTELRIHFAQNSIPAKPNFLLSFFSDNFCIYLPCGDNSAPMAPIVNFQFGSGTRLLDVQKKKGGEVIFNLDCMSQP